MVTQRGEAIADVLGQFGRTPAGAALIAESDSERVAHRARLIAERARVLADESPAVAKLRTVLDAAEQRASVAKAALAVATGARVAALAEHHTAALRLRERIERLDNELRKFAPQAIDAFIKELYMAAAETQEQYEIRLSADQDTGGKKTTSGPAIRVRTDAIKRAAAEADGLRYKNITLQETEAAIEKLREQIPSLPAAEKIARKEAR